MKIKKYNENNSELTESQIEFIMKRAVEYDKYIEDMDKVLMKIIAKEIEPLLDIGKFDEAKDMVRKFYKKSRRARDEDGSEGDVVFLGYDMMYYRINNFKNAIKKYNL